MENLYQPDTDESIKLDKLLTLKVKNKGYNKLSKENWDKELSVLLREGSNIDYEIELQEKNILLRHYRKELGRTVLNCWRTQERYTELANKKKEK